MAGFSPTHWQSSSHNDDDDDDGGHDDDDDDDVTPTGQSSRAINLFYSQGIHKTTTDDTFCCCFRKLQFWVCRFLPFLPVKAGLVHY